MSFFSFLPSPGSVLGDLAHCLPSVFRTPATPPDFSVLDYVSALLTSVAIDLFPSVALSADSAELSLGAELSSLSLLTQFPSLLLENDQHRSIHTPL